ncbi:UvrD-helicase domain-containing protein [Neolewinella sp.]|uniref:UvrD-helicase domain-containing protein n=1 Tax=Neolewinella sp. TaxID=2993543 RepID=UPI003B527D3B
MKTLRYNDLDPHGLSRQLDKVERQLAAGDFKSADVKKMRSNGYYRAKLDREARLLFQLARYGGEPVALLLEVIPNHEYDKSTFLRGATVRESDFSVTADPTSVEEDAPTLRYVNPQASRFHLLDKVISLDGDQQEIYNLPAPLIIIGSAGSGKTALTLEKMKTYRGSVAYVSLSDYLVRNSRELYYANGYENDKQEVDFLSFNEYLRGIQVPTGRELDYRSFERWYQRKYHQRFKFKDPYKVFEEFKGVLTGSVTEAAYLSREEYLSLGIKQSIFLSAEREAVYELFEKYLELVDGGTEFYDPNITAFRYLERVEAQYDFLVVDEVQDITNVQLLLLTRSLTTPGNFILSGDSNQIVHPNFFSWSKIKTLFFNQELRGSALRILKTNYRNSRSITRLSNDLLKIKNSRFGSIDRESTYLINTVADSEGEINFLKYDQKLLRELNKRTEGSAKFAVLTMDKDQKERVSRELSTPLVFTIQEAKGLEYENIILVNFISDYADTFREITQGVVPADLEDDQLRYARARDKGNKEQEAYKFYINSLYVAFTRAVRNVYLVERTTKHDLLRLLGVVTQKDKVDIAVQSSSDTEWLDEADRLEQQGKTEQAAAIRARLRGEEFVGTEEAERLSERIFTNPAGAERRDMERLLKFATARHRLATIRRLATEAAFGPARHYLSEYTKAQKLLVSYVRSNNVGKVNQLTDKFGVALTEPDDEATGLMLAAQFGQDQLLEHFLAGKADKGRTDKLGRTALQYLLLGFDRRKVKEPQLRKWYPRLAPRVGYVVYGGRQYVINARSMEFFVANLLNALRLDVFNPTDPLSRQCLLINDFMEIIEEMPASILPDYRRKRQYVSSILSKNERDRDDRYNKRFLIRRSRGCYDMNPAAELRWEE